MQKPSEVVDEIYESTIKGDVGPRLVNDLKASMLKAAKKNVGKPKAMQKAIVKAAMAFLEEKGKTAPKKLTKLLLSAPVASSKEESSKKEEPKKTTGKKIIKKASKSESSEASDKGDEDVSELQGKILKQPGIATIKPADMDKAALREVLKRHHIEYDKEDKESVLRAKFTEVLKRVALPVLNYNNLKVGIDKLQENVEDGCFGILIDLTSKECPICPAVVECKTQFKANIANPDWLKKALGEDTGKKAAAKDEEEEPEEEEEEEAEGEDEEAEESSSKKKLKKATKKDEDEEEEVEEEESEDEDAEGGEEEEESAEEEDEEAEDEDAESEEEEAEEPKKDAGARKRQHKLVYDASIRVKVLDVKNPYKKADGEYDLLQDILKSKGKVITLGKIGELAKERYEFENDKDMKESVVTLVTDLEAGDDKVLKILGV